jgi:DNA-binding NarL/FixJ family response regulator
MWNSVIIASNASFLADALREKLSDVSFKVFIATNENELNEKMKSHYPRYIFLENCFFGIATDIFIQGIVKRNSNIRIAVWTVSEIKPFIAARYIVAGAESFFSLRDTCRNIETIINQIAEGRHYCPANVEMLLEKENFNPEININFTNRELQIIKHLASGKDYLEISQCLSLSINTIIYHKNNILRKIGIKKNIDILRYTLLHEIIQKEDLE